MNNSRNGTSSNTTAFFRGLIDLAIPPLCTACGEYTEVESSLCESCTTRFDRYDYPICLQCENPLFDRISCADCPDDTLSLFAFGNYVDPLKETVHQFKFRGVTRVADYFAEEIAIKFGPLIRQFGPAILAPIPLHPSREHARGFNQSVVFANALGSKLNLEVDTKILARIKKGKPHSRLSDSARAENIKNAFAPLADTEDGETLILIDDVVTGGHTVRSARSTLIHAGFRVPAVISIAHGR